MDPDGDYESRYSTRSVDDIFPKDAKLDNVDESKKKHMYGENGVYDCKDNDEEMGLKPSPKADESKVVSAEAKEGSATLEPLAPQEDDLGCLPSAPPLELSSDDDGASPNTFESFHPPESPRFKEDLADGERHSIPNSVALPIGLDNTDIALPVASVVPIITDARGAEFAPPPTPPPKHPPQDSTRCCPSFFRQSSTHPAPNDESSETNLAMDHHAEGERDKSDWQGFGCTARKKCIAVATCTVVAIITALIVGFMLADGRDEPDELEVNMQSKYPDCDVKNLYWLNDDACDGAKYNNAACGWDGGDCLFEKSHNKQCTGSIGSIWTNKSRAWCQDKCTEQNIKCEAYDFTPSSGKCIIFRNYQSEKNNVLSNCWRMKQTPVISDEEYPNCHVEIQAKIGDGNCDGGQYNTEDCGWDGGDCLSNCHVDNPEWIGDGFCNGGGYNTEECGWDGDDCVVEGYPDCHVVRPQWIGDGSCDGGKYNTRECGWDGGDCLSNANCHVDNPEWVGDGFCNGGGYNTVQCAWDGGDCVVDGYPDCHVVRPLKIGDGNCDGGEYNTEECGWDGGDCDNQKKEEYSVAALYPNCNVRNEHWLNDDTCDGSTYNNAECGYDGGDCLFNKNSGKACVGSVRSTWTNKTRRWCQFKCLSEGDFCKAYDFDDNADKCRIFSSYSSKTSKNNSKCYKKK